MNRPYNDMVQAQRIVVDPVAELEAIIRRVFGTGTYDEHKVVAGLYGLVEGFYDYCQIDGNVSREFIRDFATRVTKGMDCVGDNSAEIKRSKEFFALYLFSVSLQHRSLRHRIVVDILNKALLHYENMDTNSARPRKGAPDTSGL